MSAKPKQSKKAMPVDNRGKKVVISTETNQLVKMKRLTLDIPESLHRAIKTRSAEKGVAMIDMLRTLLDKHYGSK